MDYILSVNEGIITCQLKKLEYYALHNAIYKFCMTMMAIVLVVFIFIEIFISKIGRIVSSTSNNQYLFVIIFIFSQLLHKPYRLLLVDILRIKTCLTTVLVDPNSQALLAPEIMGRTMWISSSKHRENALVAAIATALQLFVI